MEHHRHEHDPFKKGWPRFLLIGLAGLVLAETCYIYGCMNKHKEYIPNKRIEQNQEAPTKSGNIINPQEMYQINPDKYHIA